MRRLIAATILGASLMASPVFAQSPDPAPDFSAAEAALTDPARQEQMAQTIAVLGEVLLDLPLAPLAQAAAEMAGDDPADIGPDLTIRKMAPEASDAPRELADNVPRAMNAMAGMLSGLEAMLPALRDMAARMENAVPAQ